MKRNDKIDTAGIDLMLGELRLSGLKAVWTALAATADKEGWPAVRFLAALAEQELADRSQRRFARHLAEAHLPPGKTPRCLRLRCRANDLQGTSPGTRRR